MKNGRTLVPSGRPTQLERVIRRSFDTVAVARLSVGPTWASLTEAQRQELTESLGRYKPVDPGYPFEPAGLEIIVWRSADGWRNLRKACFGNPMGSLRRIQLVLARGPRTPSSLKGSLGMTIARVDMLAGKPAGRKRQNNDRSLIDPVGIAAD